MTDWQPLSAVSSQFLGLAWSLGTIASTLSFSSIAWAEQPLSVVYPSDGHETTAAQIFLIGTAPVGGEVTVNGQAIDRSAAGHFAPSFPLALGDNQFTLRYGEQTVTLTVKRTAAQPALPEGSSFLPESLTPSVDIARRLNEPICFNAIAQPNTTVSVSLGNQTLPLLPQPNAATLPDNSAVLTGLNQPIASSLTAYAGCLTIDRADLFNLNSVPNGDPSGVPSGVPSPGSEQNLGYPLYQFTHDGQTSSQASAGLVQILSDLQPQVVQVSAEQGTARSGPSTDYSRLTPLPQGTRATVTGREGEWLRLDYGAWIRERDVEPIANAVPPQTLIRSLRVQPGDRWTEVQFPLQTAVPISLQQTDRLITLTLHNTIAQTDTIRVNQNSIVERIDWQQVTPNQVQYQIRLKSEQQWGYKLHYDGTTLVLSLRQPPILSDNARSPLAGLRILLDPGHGGPEDLGARGPTGLPEKTVTLELANQLRDRLIALGATVYLTREGDIDLGPNERAALINQLEPTIALSLHYNALPDDGNAEQTAGFSSFWYNPQAFSLAQALHDRVVTDLDRPSDGIFWNNLALTRPTVAPSVLLEMGFMIHPEEFEWIRDPASQAQLADTLATGIVDWFRQTAP